MVECKYEYICELKVYRNCTNPERCEAFVTFEVNRDATERLMIDQARRSIVELLNKFDVEQRGVRHG